MEYKTGRVAGVNGNLVKIIFDDTVIKNEVGFILVGNETLKGEVIRITNGVADLQVYEDTNGIMVGDQVKFTGELLSVELGPGLLTQVFDGLQNPLPELAEKTGFFLKRGVYLDAIPNKGWDLVAVVKVG
ncbi:MAG: V-type ATP synthase subunit A, partial [Spirochaetales bacterium]|nr:V-type ATP synthase subunit A [Candidatus Physcosoma equi]